MRVILHIGAWKTGSSAIQDFLNAHQAKLRRRGYLTPRFATPPNGHHRLVRAARDNDAKALAELVAEIKREAERARAHTVILSSEHYWPLVRRHQKRLRGALAPLDPEFEILAYIRPQEEMWTSLYAQQAKWMRVRPETPFWGDYSFVGAGIVDIGLWYGKCMTTFRRVFEAKMHVRRYERARFAGGDVVQDFLQACGIEDLSGLDLSPRESNASFGWKGVAFAMHCAETLPPPGSEAEAIRRRSALSLAVRDTGRQLEDQDWMGRAPVFMDDEERRRIRAHYAEDTAVLERRFFDGEPAFQPVKSREPAPLGPASLPAAEREIAAALMHERLNRRTPLQRLRASVGL